MSVDTKGVLIYKESEIKNPLFFFTSVLERIKKAIEKEMNKDVDTLLVHRGFQRARLMTSVDFRVACPRNSYFQAIFAEREGGEAKWPRTMHIFFDCDCDHKERIGGGERSISFSMGDSGCSRQVTEAVLRAFPEFGQYFQPCDAADEYKKIN